MDIEYFDTIRSDILAMIEEDKNNRISVLEIGCGTGATLLQIKREYPNAQVFGVELQESVVEMGEKFIPIICDNIENKNLEFDDESFDYIILGDVLEHLVDPEDMLTYLQKFLKKDGHIITSIPNLQHYSVLVPLLFGEFEYFEAGITDRTHLRFFTGNSIRNMIDRVDCDIVEMVRNVDESTMQPWIDAVLNQLCKISSDINRLDFITWQYLVKIKKNCK